MWSWGLLWECAVGHGNSLQEQEGKGGELEGAGQAVGQKDVRALV